MSRTLSLAHAARHALHEVMREDPSVMVWGASVGRLGGVAGSTEGLREAFPDRVHDTPIADRGTVGMAVGLALGGKRPVVCLDGSEQVPAVLAPLADAGRIAGRGEFGVPLVLRVPVGADAVPAAAELGPLLAAVPGIRVVSPADPNMAAGLLRWALTRNAPTVILEPRPRMHLKGLVEDAPVTPNARLLREGEHVTLAAWGEGVSAAHHAAEILEHDGIQADVLDLVSLVPLDSATLGERVRTTGRLVAVHPPAQPAWADAVRQAGLDKAFLYLEAPIATAPAHSEPVAHAARAAVTY